MGREDSRSKKPMAAGVAEWGAGRSWICGHGEEFRFYSSILNSGKSLHRNLSWGESILGERPGHLEEQWAGSPCPGKAFGGQQCCIYSPQVSHVSGLGTQEIWEPSASLRKVQVCVSVCPADSIKPSFSPEYVGNRSMFLELNEWASPALRILSCTAACPMFSA